MSAPIPDHIRAAAIADYYATGDTAKDVADRHGIARSTFSKWVNQSDDHETRVYEPLAYAGSTEFDPSAWEVRGGVLRPLFPERRTA